MKQKLLTNQLKEELREEYKNSDKFFNKSFKLAQNSINQSYIEEINNTGVTVIENFFSSEECDSAIDIIEKSIDIYKNKVQADAVGSDQRLFGINKINTSSNFNEKEKNIINKFNKSELIKDITEIFYTSSFSGFTMAAKMIYKPNNLGSGGGWHRDSVATRQIKSILYLTNVSIDNGPFQFLEKSHTPENVYLDTLKFNIFNKRNRINDKTINKIMASKKYKLSTYTAPKGTLILADTRGIHRGKPILSGNRYALTNYFWKGNRNPQHILKLCI